MRSDDQTGSQELKALSESQIYRDYERAFTRGTGLPLRLHGPNMLEVIHYDQKLENPLCALLAKSNQSCAACYRLQCKLEAEAQMEPKTLKCFAGLCETAVPVRVGENLIAFLQTGQVLLQIPDKVQFNEIAATLLKWGSEVDLKRLEEAYFNTRVLSPGQYESLICLLQIFADHLGACSSNLLLQAADETSPAINQASRYIQANSTEDLSLATVARVVNMSASYFSAKFKEATGLNFVEYVARTRIEKAKNLLQNPHFRVAEIAFEVGFQSLSQFNRAFKQLAGASPSEYRRALKTRE